MESASVRYHGGSVLVDPGAGGEPLEPEGGAEGVRSPVRDGVRIDPAGAGRGLEAAGTPSAIDEEVFDRGQPEDRRRVRGDVDDPGPGADHVRATEDREQLNGGRQLLLDHMRRTALPIGVVLVDPGAHHQLTFVALADVDVD